MAKDYDDIGGVWRTIGGRRVFIKTGQSLSEAMIESGKFKNLREEYRKSKEEEPKKENKYDSTKHEGFGDYNDDYIPVYDGKIDYTGDFSRADLSKLSDEELKTALNKQNELYKEALNEKLGDQRTRNGKMDKIFNTAKQQQYENGTNALLEEMNKRDLPRYNIYNENGLIMASSPTKEIADAQLKDMYETDKKLQKEYGWEKLPQYTVKEGKVDEYLNEKKDTAFTQKSTSPFYPDRDYTQEDLNKMAEAGVRPTKNTYSGSGWEGVNSDKNLSTSEQAKAITDTMKEKYPDVKISRKSDVYSGGSSITFSVMSSDKDLYVSNADIDKMDNFDRLSTSNGFEYWANENVPGYKTNHTYRTEDVREYAKKVLSDIRQRDNQSVRGDEWYLSDYGKQVMSDLNKTANSYTYDDSDAMTDYFNHGTYMWVNIGKWDKPYQVNAKATGETINNTLRQKAYQKYLKEHPGSKMTFEEFKK